MIPKEARTGTRHAVVLALTLCGMWTSVAAQDVSFEVQTRSRRTEFHVGEVILLDLKFGAHTPDRYRLISGGSFVERFPFRDTFRVEPASGWKDPLVDYRKALYKAETSGHFPIATSVMLNSIVLNPEPYVLAPIVLNDYIRFWQPGVYTLQVEDSRVTAVPADIKPERLTLASNRLELTIVAADVEWQQSQLREALSALSQLRQAIQSGARSYRAILADSCITIRTLGINGAGTAMVDALRDEDLFSRCGFQAGIWEFSNKRFILERMRQLLKDPEVAITYTFLDTMATTSLLANRQFDQLFTLKPRRIDQQLKDEILATLPAKRGEAKTRTINTLVGISFARYGGSTGELMRAEKISKLDSRVLQVATDNFDQLSPSTQKTLLNYRKARHLN